MWRDSAEGTVVALTFSLDPVNRLTGHALAEKGTTPYARGHG